MNDFIDFMSGYGRHREAMSKINEHDESAVFDRLAEHEISAVKVEFDGEGDSGQINAIVAFAGHKQRDP